MRLIAIIGMHRSGTSAAAGLLARLGIDPGPDETLLPAQADNPLGFWENAELVEINTRILEKLGGTWSAPPGLPDGWVSDDMLGAERIDAAKLLERLSNLDSDYVLVKDPRLSLTLPFWNSLYPVHATIASIRHPLDTAASLTKRNGFTTEKGLYLWMRYVAAAWSAKPDPLFVVHADLMTDPAAVARDMLRHVGYNRNVTEEEITAVDQRLWHHRDGLVVEGPLGESASIVFEAIRLGEVNDEVRRMLGLFARQAWPVVGTSDIRRFRREIEQLTHKNDTAQREVARLTDSHRGLEQSNADLRTIADELRARFAAESANIVRLQEHLLERNHELSRATTELAEHQSTLERAKADLAQERARLAALEEQARRSSEARRRAVDNYERLRQRKSVRAALGLAAVTRPFYSAARNLRDGVTSRRPSAANLPVTPEGPIRSRFESFDRELERATKKALANRYTRKARHYDSVSVSVVMPVFNRSETVGPAIESVIAQTHPNWELIVVDDGSTDETPTILAEYAGDPRIRVVRTENRGVSEARNSGVRLAGGELVAYLDSDNVWLPEYLRSMVVGLVSTGSDCGYAAMEVVDPDGIPLYYRGDRFDWSACRFANYVDLNVFVHRRTNSAFEEGFDPVLRRMVDWDFILRATRDQEVLYLPIVGCRYRDDAGEAHRISNAEPLVWDRIVRERHQDDGTMQSWAEVSNRLSFDIAVKIPAPSYKKAEWGDYHFAESLAAALERLGQSVRIDFVDEWDSAPPAEVNIVLRGLTAFRPAPEAVNILWMISHPDKVDPDELIGFDRIYVASESHARLLGFVLEPGRAITYLPQATDSGRFNPARRGERPDLEGSVLFVGNSRNHHREIVRWATESGVDLKIFGRGWEPFLDDDLIAGELIDNRELGGAYASAGIVLNDHWESMRDFGLVSNRVFDVLATGTPLISDRVDALGRMFGDVVRQVGSAEELSRAVESIATHPDQDDVAQWIAAEHSFDARAATILDDLLAFFQLPARSREQGESTFSAPSLIRRSPETMKVGLIWTDGADGPQSSAYIRLIAPLTSEGAPDIRPVRVDPRDIPSDLDALVVQRTSVPFLEDAQRLVDDLERTGVPLVVDSDDAFRLIGPDHPEFELYQLKSEALDYLMTRAEQVWFTTDYLRTKHDHLTFRDARVMPNSLDPRFWRTYRRTLDESERPPGPPRILYMGTTTHDADWGMVLPDLDALAESVEFELYIVGGLRGAVPERPWINRLRIPHGSSVYPRFTYWLRHQGPFDIGLSPLVDTEFNRCKSDIKFLDYTALELISVVSDLTPYHGDVRDRKLAAHAGPTDWLERLADVVANMTDYRDMQIRATEYLWKERSASKAGSEIAAALAEARTAETRL